MRAFPDLINYYRFVPLTIKDHKKGSNTNFPLFQKVLSKQTLSECEISFAD